MTAPGAKPKGRRSKGVINRISTWLESDICHLLIHRNNARPLRCYSIQTTQSASGCGNAGESAQVRRRMAHGLCIGVEMV